ncbi:hypothetical protein Lal_00021869 [Lupinus albus]|nr:hypothetical protein Lal_00021869 [Lupinus albus]
MMLNNPYEVKDGHMDGYHIMMEKSRIMTHEFNIDETAEQLCIPGRTVSANVDGRPKMINRKDTTTKRRQERDYGFPVLDPSLCARQGVQVTPTEPIKKPITKQYIKQNCKEDNVEPQGQQPP